MPSQMFGCCSYKAWGQSIAWIHIVLYGILSLSYIILLFVLAAEGTDKAGFSEDAPAAAVIALIILILVAVVGVLWGIYLLRSIREQNAAKLWNWLIVETILTGLRILSFLIGVATGNSAIAVTLLGIFVNTFSIYIVFQYRKEILQQLPVIQTPMPMPMPMPGPMPNSTQMPPSVPTIVVQQQHQHHQNVDPSFGNNGQFQQHQHHQNVDPSFGNHGQFQQQQQQQQRQQQEQSDSESGYY